MNVPSIVAILLMAISSAPAIEAQTTDTGCEQRKDPTPGLSGVWQVRVEKLSIWAPRHTLNKTLGMTRWKLAIAADRISLSEYSPDSGPYGSPESGARGVTFEEVEVEDAVIRDDQISFTVKDDSGALEHYRLEQFSDHRISGTYVVQDRAGGTAGQASEHRGCLILEKVE